MRALTGGVLLALVLTGCAGHGVPIDQLATGEHSLEDVDVCGAARSIPDFEDRAQAILGVDDVEVVNDDSETESRYNRGCIVGVKTEDGAHYPYLDIGVTQESDEANVVAKEDREIYPGCWLDVSLPSDREPQPNAVSVRCRPSLDVYVTAFGNAEHGVAAWPGPVDAYVDLAHDLLVGVSEHG